MILLLTHSQDYYTIDGVEAALRRLGEPFFRINTDQFPTHLTLTARFPGAHLLEAQGHELDLSQVKAIWARRLYPGRLPPDFPEEAGAISSLACRISFRDTFGLLDKARWINPVRAQERAESKILQLRVADKVGLRVPPTTITNRAEEVRSFAQEHGQLITKLLVPTVQTMEAHPAFVYTTRILPEHLDQLDQLWPMPQIFQPELRKKAELRVIVVDDQLFVGSLEGGHVDLVDWRQATPEMGMKWVPGNLSEAVAEKVFTLMDELGLVFGALDFIDDGSGDPWFLEVNPAGEWGWLERDLGFPIAETIARALLT